MVFLEVILFDSLWWPSGFLKYQTWRWWILNLKINSGYFVKCFTSIKCRFIAARIRKNFSNSENGQQTTVPPGTLDDWFQPSFFVRNIVQDAFHDLQFQERLRSQSTAYFLLIACCQIEFQCDVRSAHTDKKLKKHINPALCISSFLHIAASANTVLNHVIWGRIWTFVSLRFGFNSDIGREVNIHSSTVEVSEWATLLVYWSDKNKPSKTYSDSCCNDSRIMWVLFNLMLP